jgi:hypothetical protein
MGRNGNCKSEMEKLENWNLAMRFALLVVIFQCGVCSVGMC